MYNRATLGAVRDDPMQECRVVSSSYFDYPGTAPPDQPSDEAFLAAASEVEWEKLINAAELVRATAGETVLGTDEADRALIIVAEGALESSGRTIAAGEVAGIVAFFDGQPQPETVRAAADSELLRLSFERFEALAAREPALARTVLLELGRILTVQLRRTAPAQ